ncbi:hypothetical protein EON65_01410 [archaeon]|nr:MAG: hypothetical protein EON65_01410 [archaeon]
MFDELDRQCANHFLARKVALRGKQMSERFLSRAQRPFEISIGRVLCEGWAALSEAQAALAHTCIVMVTIKSAKISFIFDSYKALTQALQQKLEEEWVMIDSAFPLTEAKATIRDLRLRLSDFILGVHSEIVVEKDRKQSRPAAMVSTSSSKRNNRNLRFLSSESFEDGRGGESADYAYYDAVDRIRGLDIQEKAELASAVFGNAFGGSLFVYTSTRTNHSS